MPEMAPNVRAAHDAVVRALGELEEFFPEGRYKLTFCARYVGPEALDADVVISSEKDYAKAAEAILALSKRPDAEVVMK